jgi:hypothetical protein
MKRQPIKTRRDSKRKPKARGRTRVTKQTTPRTAAQYNAKSERFKQAYERTIKVLSKMRTEKLTLTQAAKDVGVSRDTVIRWGGPVLKKTASGRYEAKNRDSLLRVLTIVTPEGTREIAVRGFRQASTLGEYWASVQKYLKTGDSSSLSKFQDRSIKDAAGAMIPLLTDLRELKNLARAGLLSFESLYRRSA